MIFNIKNKKDLITLDLRTKQLRYLTDIKNNGLIQFINLSNDDIKGYEFLFNNDIGLFFKSLKEDIKTNLNIDINLIDLNFMGGLK